MLTFVSHPAFAGSLSCAERGSEKISDTLYIICGEAQADTSVKAMEQALVNGRNEFLQFCIHEYCDVNNLSISPKRSECSTRDSIVSCIRYFEYQVNDLDYESDFKSCNQLPMRNYDQAVFDVCGMAIKESEGEALEVALAKATAQFFKLCQQKYCHIRNIDIYPKDTFCHRSSINRVECSQYVKVEVLDRQFDPDITHEHHVEEVSVLFGRGWSNWQQENSLMDEALDMTGTHLRVAYSVSQYVSLGYRYFDLTSDSAGLTDEAKQSGQGVDFHFYPNGYNQGVYLGAGAGVRNYQIGSRVSVLDDFVEQSNVDKEVSYGLLGYKLYFSQAILDIGGQIELKEEGDFSNSQVFIMFGVGF
jgi:hypothetical protein